MWACPTPADTAPKPAGTPSPDTAPPAAGLAAIGTPAPPDPPLNNDINGEIAYPAGVATNGATDVAADTTCDPNPADVPPAAAAGSPAAAPDITACNGAAGVNDETTAAAPDS